MLLLFPIWFGKMIITILIICQNRGSLHNHVYLYENLEIIEIRALYQLLGYPLKWTFPHINHLWV